MLKTLKQKWRNSTGRSATPFDGGAPFFFVSLVAHLVLLLILTCIVLPPGLIREIVLQSTSTQEVETVEVEELKVSELSEDTIGNLGEDQGDMMSAAREVVFKPLKPVDSYKLLDDFGTDPNPDQATILAAKESTEDHIVLGVSGVGVSGAKGAIDQITEEIKAYVDQGPTVVVWLFDQSASLETQRKEIRSRFERVYRELDEIFDFNNPEVKHKDAVLLTQIYSFWNAINRLMPKPSRNAKELLEAFDKIERDQTGVERTFTAISKAVTEQMKYRRASNKNKRNVMVIVVSDEAGDDYNMMDNAIKLCRKTTVPVYVLGVPAPFGRRRTPVKWIDPDPNYDQTPQWTYVNQGPESLGPERLNLGFFGQSRNDVEIIDSGFGPYALSRLTVETGGVYFSVHPNRKKGRNWRTAANASKMSYFFDSMLMRRYQPEYLSVDQYSRSLKSNGCRMALVNAAGKSNVSRGRDSSIGAIDPPDLIFRKFNEAEFVNRVTRAQRAAAALEPRLNALYSILAVGESQRPQEVIPRWKAGFDLAMGRLLAARVRTEAYNVMLASAKTRLKFRNPKNNTWELEASDSLDAGSRLKKDANKAIDYLERVVADHPGTPWALLAQKELAIPIGWKWTERFIQPPRPPAARPPGNPNPNPVGRDDRRNMIQRKPTRKPPKL